MTQVQDKASITSSCRCDLDAPVLLAHRKTPDDWQFEYVVHPAQDADFIRAIVQYNSQLDDAFRPHFPVGIILLFPAIGAYSCYRHLSAMEQQQ